MNKTLKRKWIKALRSGRYRKGLNTLKTGQGHNTRYCCLGVLAQISGVKWKEEFSGFRLPFKDGKCVGMDGQRADFLDPEFFGIPMKVQRRLAEQNDRGLPFEDIADLIKEWED